MAGTSGIYSKLAEHYGCQFTEQISFFCDFLKGLRSMPSFSKKIDQWGYSGFLGEVAFMNEVRGPLGFLLHHVETGQLEGEPGDMLGRIDPNSMGAPEYFEIFSNGNISNESVDFGMLLDVPSDGFKGAAQVDREECTVGEHKGLLDAIMWHLDEEAEFDDHEDFDYLDELIGLRDELKNFVDSKNIEIDDNRGPAVESALSCSSLSLVVPPGDYGPDFYGEATDGCVAENAQFEDPNQPFRNALELLLEGQPTAALDLGRYWLGWNGWCLDFGIESKEEIKVRREHALILLHGAYEALGRPFLNQVLRKQHRDFDSIIDKFVP